jgi:hypothetical protein
MSLWGRDGEVTKPAPSRPLGAVDVAIMTYRKPESLIYTLLTLRQHCLDGVRKVWIGDDCSGPEAWALLSAPELAERLAPWRVQLYSTSRWGGWSETLVTGRMLRRLISPLSGLTLCDRLRAMRGLVRRGLRPAEDIRYECALKHTKAEAVMILHDDVQVRGDVVGLYRKALEADPDLAIVGQLGQCWRCGEAGQCSPAALLAGQRPSPRWPATAPPKGKAGLCRADRACRINEWCCMVRTSAARDLAQSGIHFGNSEGGGDTGAYWFGAAVSRGWRFADPFIGTHPFPVFHHGWQGYMGHQVWSDRADARVPYRAEEVVARLWDEFGYALTPQRRLP